MVPGVSTAKEKRGVVTVSVNLNAPEDSKQVRLWIPYPMSSEHQEITGVSIGGNYSSMGMYREGSSGAGILFAEWEGPATSRTLTYSFHVVRREAVTRDFSGGELPFFPREFRRYLAPTTRGPTDGTAGR